MKVFLLGILLGLPCGLTELWLLKRLVRSIPSEKIALWVIPAKIAALLLFFVPCALLAPDQLAVCGISAAAALIIGAVGLLLRGRKPRTAAEGDQS